MCFLYEFGGKLTH